MKKARKLLSGGIRHHFLKYRLYEERINEIMISLGEKILKLPQEQEARIEFTQLEASGYYGNADYNSHYECIMYQAQLQWLELILLLGLIQMVLLLIILNLLNICKLYKKRMLIYNHVLQTEIIICYLIMHIYSSILK